jgi:hypothetical protein
MDYYTTAEQESEMQERYQRRCDQEQDRMRGSLYRVASTIKEEDRIFFVEEDGRIYLGEIHPKRECPIGQVTGGGSYGVDFMFVREVEEFLKRSKRYVVIFQMRRDYSTRAGIYPARMISADEELMLEEVPQS